jgi:hypothetical protein
MSKPNRRSNWRAAGGAARIPPARPNHQFDFSGVDFSDEEPANSPCPRPDVDWPVAPPPTVEPTQDQATLSLPQEIIDLSDSPAQAKVRFKQQIFSRF